MNLLLLSRYGTMGASSRFRCYQYIPYLEAAGHSVTTVPLLSDGYLEALYRGKRIPTWDVWTQHVRRLRVLMDSNRFDLIWVQQEFFPWLPAWLESMVYSSSIPFIVDFDDAFFHRYDMHGSAIVRNILGRKIDRVMAQAAAVVSGNEYIADRAAKAGARRVEIIPTVVDDTEYKMVERPVSDKFTIGWIGSPSTFPYVRDIEEGLRVVLVDGNSRVMTVGEGEKAQIGIPTERRPWILGREPEEIAAFDVGIMPLRNTPWERGKCGFKLVQYMATGLPVVASPVGINTQIVEHGVNGFLATTTEEWVSALRTLRDDRGLRVAMGVRGRARVELSYALRQTAPRLLQLFQEIAGRKK